MAATANGSLGGCRARDLLVATREQPPDRESIHAELERVRADMHQLVSNATTRDLRRRTNGTRWTNYVGAVGGALVFHGARLTRQVDHTIDRLHRRLDAEDDAALGRRMHFPVGWDPFFYDSMTLEQVYHYPTQHYYFHRNQLTLDPASRS